MKPNLPQILAHTIGIAQQLNPRRLQHQLDEWTRGGLPTTSISAGTPTHSEPPTPTFDRDDRTFHDLGRRYRHAISEAARHLEIARRIEAIVIPPARTDRRRYGLWRAEASRQAVKDHGPGAEPCKICGRPVACTAADPMRAGRCSACDMWHRRHGTDRPRTDDTPAA